MDSTRERGMSVFVDVFRRADKTDDSALHWEEFRSYFTDGVLSEEELKNLFCEIDTHNTNNIDTEELCSYFSKHLGPFKEIFCAIEDLNQSVSKALVSTAKDYPESSMIEQFTTRFLVREITSQLGALLSPLDQAADVLDEKALESRRCQSAATMEGAESTKAVVEVDAASCHNVSLANITPGRVARRARRQLATQTSWSPDSIGSGALGQQIDRLRSLVDKLENKVNFDTVPEEEVIETDNEDQIVVVSRRMHLEEGHEKAFKNSLRNYLEATGKLEECLSVSVRSVKSSSLVVVYEVWRSPEDWQNFCSNSASKNFRHSIIDHLALPEQMNSLRLPDSWWNKH